MCAFLTIPRDARVDVHELVALTRRASNPWLSSGITTATATGTALTLLGDALTLAGHAA